MKNIMILLIAFVGLSAQAQQTQSKAEFNSAKKNKNAKYAIEVNGNCEQCKKRIEKAAYTVSGVKMATWSIETHRLDLILNEEKSTLTDVKNALAKAGHDSEGVKATDEDYKNLHTCCQYERK